MSPLVGAVILLLISPSLFGATSTISGETARKWLTDADSILLFEAGGKHYELVSRQLTYAKKNHTLRALDLGTNPEQVGPLPTTPRWAEVPLDSPGIERLRSKLLATRFYYLPTDEKIPYNAVFVGIVLTVGGAEHRWYWNRIHPSKAVSQLAATLLDEVNIVLASPAAKVTAKLECTADELNHGTAHLVLSNDGRDKVTLAPLALADANASQPLLGIDALTSSSTVGPGEKKILTLRLKPAEAGQHAKMPLELQWHNPFQSSNFDLRGTLLIASPCPLKNQQPD